MQLAQVKFTQGTNYCKALTGTNSEPSIPVVIRCQDCRKVKIINPSCNQRNCERCNQKRANKLFKRYYGKMIAMHNNPRRSYKEKWRIVTLTGFRIPFDNDFRKRVKWFSDCAQKFLDENYPTGGILSVEMTVHRKGHFQGAISNDDEMTQYQYISTQRELYVHAHGVCFGGFHDKKNFDADWGAYLYRAMLKAGDNVPMLESSYRERSERFTWLETVRNVKGSLNYVLGYVLKGIMVSDEELEAVKRLKYIRTWGELYGIHDPEYDMYCADCGGRCYLDYDGETLFDAMAGFIKSELKILMVIRGDPPPTIQKGI